MNEDTKTELKELLGNQFEIRTSINNQIGDIEKKIMLGEASKEDRIELKALKARLTATDNSIAELNKEIQQYQNTAKTEEFKQSMSDEHQIINKLIQDYHIGYLTTQNHYAYCIGMEEQNSNLVNPIFNQVDATKFGRVLNKMANKKLKLSWKAMAPDLADYFQDSGNDYYTTTASFHNQKWGKNKAYNKAHIIRKFWVQPDYTNKDVYDKRFDFLIYCVAGGKAENMDHLEQWIGYKFLYPERVANTPNLDIGGFPGGNGKGRYIELCKTIFTNPCVIAAALKELMDGFNATWEMATLLYYDEPASNELPEGKLKQATGGEDMRSEKKGIDATITDRNYSLLFVSNNINGVVKLAGTGAGGEDRRYSVMITDKVMVDEAINLGLVENIDQSKIFVNSINDLIKQRAEVAKWLGFIIEKHDLKNLKVLHALHGQDYKARFESQKKELDVAFDKLLPVYMHNKCIPTKILWELVVGITGYDKLSQKKCTQDWERYLAKNKIPHHNVKVRVRHLFNGEQAYESNPVATIKMEEHTTATFDHKMFSAHIPTKDTHYTSTNIDFDQQEDEPQPANVVAFKPLTPAQAVRQKLEEIRKK